MEHVPREPGSEEYLDSEKYEISAWDRERADSLRTIIARVNAIRRANPALQRDERLRFHAIDNEQLICYSKTTEDFDNVDPDRREPRPAQRQSGWIDARARRRSASTDDEAFEVHDC